MWGAMKQEIVNLYQLLWHGVPVFNLRYSLLLIVQQLKTIFNRPTTILLPRAYSKWYCARSAVCVLARKIRDALNRCWNFQWIFEFRFGKPPKKSFLQILQIRGGIYASFLKIRKFKFSKFPLLPLSRITNISERK